MDEIAFPTKAETIAWNLAIAAAAKVAEDRAAYHRESARKMLLRGHEHAADDQRIKEYEAGECGDEIRSLVRFT